MGSVFLPSSSPLPPQSLIGAFLSPHWWGRRSLPLPPKGGRGPKGKAKKRQSRKRWRTKGEGRGQASPTHFVGSFYLPTKWGGQSKKGLTDFLPFLQSKKVSKKYASFIFLQSKKKPLCFPASPPPPLCSPSLMERGARRAKQRVQTNGPFLQSKKDPTKWGEKQGGGQSKKGPKGSAKPAPPPALSIVDGGKDQRLGGPKGRGPKGRAKKSKKKAKKRRPPSFSPINDSPNQRLGEGIGKPTPPGLFISPLVFPSFGLFLQSKKRGKRRPKQKRGEACPFPLPLFCRAKKRERESRRRGPKGKAKGTNQYNKKQVCTNKFVQTTIKDCETKNKKKRKIN